MLLLCAEDGLADTVRPRIDAAGGDPSQVEVLVGVREGDHDRLVNLATDLAVLEYGLKHYRPSLVVIDPLNAYLGATDSYKDADVRGLLAPLLALADRAPCVLLWVAHLTKDSDRKALYRAGGSIAFVAAARVVVLVGEHPNERDVRVAVQSKNNLLPTAAGLTFRVDTGAVVWGETVTLRADDILRMPASTQEIETATSAADMIARLRSESAHGGIDVKDANGRAELLGISSRTLRQAARRAGLVPYSRGFGRGRDSFWFDPARVPDAEAAKEVMRAQRQQTDPVPEESG